MLERILRQTASELRVELFVDGVATDADLPPTVTITRDSDGTLIADGAASTDAAGTGVYSYTLAPADIPDVDLLRVEWTATINGAAGQVFHTEAEVVGGFIATLDAISDSLPASTTPTTDELIAARGYAERWIEDACGVAFRRSYARDTLDGEALASLLLSRPRPVAVLAASVGGTALTQDELDDIELYPNGTVRHGTTWASGHRNVSVAYAHGYETTPAPVTQATIRLARHHLIERPSNLDERATRIETEEAAYSLVTPGVRGAVFALPEVNAVLAEYGYASGVA